MPLPAELQQAYLDLDDFDALLNAGDFATALARIANAEMVLAQHGVRSAHLKYFSSAIAGRLGQHLEALDFISAALELDPLNPTIQHRRYVILSTMVNALKDASSTSPFIVPWYQALVAEDYADASVHEAYARHLLATRRPTEALRILDALAVLSPSAATVASLRADVLAASGGCHTPCGFARRRAFRRSSRRRHQLEGLHSRFHPVPVFASGEATVNGRGSLR